MKQILVTGKTNVLERAGTLGTDLIIDYLYGYRTPAEISRIIREAGFKTTDSNIRKTLASIKAKYVEKPKKVGIELITHHMVETRLAEIQKEFHAAIIQDPIMVLHKNIGELEVLKNPSADIKVYGSILELQSKFATNLAKLQPPDIVKININQLLEKNDLGVNFIIQMDSKHPELDLKNGFLEFLQANSDDI